MQPICRKILKRCCEFQRQFPLTDTMACNFNSNLSSTGKKIPCYSRGRWPTVSSCYTRQCFMQLIALCTKLFKTSRCFWCPVFHFRVRSNAWLLSFKCSVRVLVVYAKICRKTLLNEDIPVNKYQKKINHMSKLAEMMFIRLY